MHFSTLAGVTLLASQAAAAPTPGLFNLNLNGLNLLNSLLSKLGITVSTNAASHGPTKNYQNQCPFTITAAVDSGKRFLHDITWPKGYNSAKWIDWKTYKANGVNLGGWLEKELTHDPIWWAQYSNDTIDEWSLCAQLGDRCGPVLEERYGSFLNTTTIDLMASVGVNTLRIPTTYAAWVKVPGSKFYTGNQQTWLRQITNYAIDKYGMHVIVGLHSLPGGVNSLDIGEAFGHGDWFFNATNLDYSLQAIDGILNFIKTSNRMQAFTIAPINEASDTHLAGFGTADGLTLNGTNWINTYINATLKKIAKVDKRIPLMLQDNFKGASYWSPFYDASTNLVMDSHVYYFAAAGAYANYVLPAVCGQAAYIAEETKFPVFIGEWALQTMYNNTLAGRKTVFDTQRYAWQKYVAGGAFWTAVSYSTAKVDGEGTQREYWSYGDLINQGVITAQTNSSYC
ncbi:hypothetical protein B9Z65_1657 [Elsinoe australis]|uniref:glucan 1,3-beta-glucosidase n=1 Tax=Elsinoe australis TaxID=40998 RepID=A0A2P7YGJ7_9PEZI|nr:hypothetical protein B9Z65_1657 [Elsinoe australis]